MYKQDELENMKLYELKNLARKSKISGHLTTKRDIINHLLNEPEENLDSETISFACSPDSVEGSSVSTSEGEVESNIDMQKQSHDAIINQNSSEHYYGAVTRSGRARSKLFPKPRMTVFQNGDESDYYASHNAGSSQRGHGKYFTTPYSLRRSTMNGGVCNFVDTVSSKKKKSVASVLVFNPKAAEENEAFSDSQRENRPITRSMNPILNDKSSDELHEHTLSSTERKSTRSKKYSKKTLDKIEDQAASKEIFELHNFSGDFISMSNDVGKHISHRRKRRTRKTRSRLNERTLVKKDVEKTAFPTSPTVQEDTADDKENETLDLHTEVLLNETFEIKNKENNDNTEGRKRSNRNETKETSKLTFFSPIGQSTTSSSKVKGTPEKTSKIPKYKMPDFKNIHKKEFEKMESLVDNHQRKLNRAKTLMTPRDKKTECKTVPPVMIFTAQPAAVTHMQYKKPMIQNVKEGTHIPQRVFGIHNNLNSPRSNTGRIIQKNDIKQMVTKKLPVHGRQGNIREASRTTIQGVRLNRRFELQMAHRKLT